MQSRFAFRAYKRSLAVNRAGSRRGSTGEGAAVFASTDLASRLSTQRAAFAMAYAFLFWLRISWFSETGTPWNGKGKSPVLGFHGEQAFALLYNGILGDKTPKGGNVLTRDTLAIIDHKIATKKHGFNGTLTIYGEASRLSDVTLARKGITFKQTPYDVKARK